MIEHFERLREVTVPSLRAKEQMTWQESSPMALPSKFIALTLLIFSARSK